MAKKLVMYARVEIDGDTDPDIWRKWLVDRLTDYGRFPLARVQVVQADVVDIDPPTEIDNRSEAQEFLDSFIPVPPNYKVGI